MRNAGKGHAGNCQDQHNQVGQRSQKQIFFARMLWDSTETSVEIGAFIGDLVSATEFPPFLSGRLLTQSQKGLRSGSMRCSCS